MSDGSPEGAPTGAPEGAPTLSAADLANVEKGRTGFSEAPIPGAPSAPAVPEGIPAKFLKDGQVDTVALAASYVELEKKLGAPKDEASPVDTAPAVAADGKIVKPAAEEKPSANPLAEVFDVAKADWESGKGFSEETAAKLAEVGIPPEIQQVYLAGLEALTKQNVGAIHGYVGGEQNYSAMTGWAAQTLTDAELDAYNAALDNPALRENAVRGLYARYTAARPGEGRMVTPASAAPGQGDTFSSRDELVAAQKDPRYATDPKYRAEVTAKLARSQAAGFRVSQPRMFDTVYSR